MADGSSASLERAFDALTETWRCPKGQRHPRDASCDCYRKPYLLWTYDAEPFNVHYFWDIPEVSRRWGDYDYATERGLRPPKRPGF